MSRSKKKQQVVSSIFLLPSVLGTGIFFFVPFVLILVFSMMDSPISQQFVFLDNYGALLQNETFILSVRNTIIFCSVAVPLAVILSLWLAKAFGRFVFCARGLQSIFLETYMIPSASVILVVKILFDRNGSINSFLVRWGIGSIDWMYSSYSMFVILIFYLWKNIGYNMVVLLAALSAVPVEAYEVAQLEGCGKKQIFFKLELRYLASALFFVTVISLGNAFKVFREVYLLEGPYPHKSLYQLQHFMNNTFLNLDYQKACAAAIILSAGILILLLGLYLLEKRAVRDMEG